MSLSTYGDKSCHTLGLNLLDNRPIDIAVISQDGLGLLTQVVADGLDHGAELIIVGRGLAACGRLDELTTLGVYCQLSVVGLGKGLVFTLAHDPAIRIGEVALAASARAVGNRGFGFIATALVLFKVLFLLLVLSHLSGKLLLVALF